MIQVTNVVTSGWEAALRGMRNPKDSWNKSDSGWKATTAKPVKPSDFIYVVGENDLKLAEALAAAGTEHRKYLRMIHVSFDVVAPLFWWLEFDTYKIATTKNSCSKMHRIHVKALTIEDTAHEGCYMVEEAKAALSQTMAVCEHLRQLYNETHDRTYWRALIELLPESYCLRATWDGTMETLLGLVHQRAHHKLYEEWEPFRQTLFKEVPYLREFYQYLYGSGSHGEGKG